MSTAEAISLAARWRVRAAEADATAKDCDPSPLSSECRGRAQAMRELANEIENEHHIGDSTELIPCAPTDPA